MIDYINGVMNYTGSKYKLLKQILPFFDYKKTTFVDLFTGGGSVYSNVIDKYDNIIINDIIKDVILIQKELIEGTDILERVQKLCVSKDDKEGFFNLRKEYNKNNSPDKLWALLLCCTNNMLRFNNKFEFNQTFGKRTINKNTYDKVDKFISKVKPYKDKITYYYNQFNTIPLLKDSFYYIDPPYGYICDNDGNIINRQISEAGYNAYYKKYDDILLYEYIHKINLIGSSFLISGLLHHNDNKSWLLTKLISDNFEYRVIDNNYNKVSRNKKNKNSIEVIIFNYKKKK